MSALLVALALIAAAPQPSFDPQPDVQESPVRWPERLDQQMALIEEWRHTPEPVVLPTQYAPPSHPIPPTEIETLIRQYFQPEDVEWGLRVSWCESHWDASAKNPTSSASGLFQHLARFWPERSAAAGWAEASIWDPVANTAVAAWLYESGGPGHWVCK